MPVQQSPFISNSWLENCGSGGFVFSKVCGLFKTNLKGIPALFTPPWALDCGLSLESNSAEQYTSFIKALGKRKEPYITVDLPPCSDDLSKGLSTAVIKQYTPTDFRVQWRHTRILDIPTKLPANRRKQVNKAERELISCELTEDWSNIILLHDESRNRKDLSIDSNQLKTLLNAISGESYSFALEAKNADGECIASGGFIMASSYRCIYAFGGQKRGPNSAIATVAMLNYAMTVAEQKGATEFDFGGSTDPGVDRFYKEFGAVSVPKPRLIRTSWWLTQILKIIRPDLF